MMDSSQNNKSNNSEMPENGHEEQSNDKASPNLNAAAEEALRLLNDSKAVAQKPADDTLPVDEEENGNTTNDLQQEAYKAMQLEAELKREADSKTAAAKRADFLVGMQLKLTSKEGNDPIIKIVDDELVVGRADNVTDYVPDIDLTPHGAYRLGLSRRHAIILREGDRVLVKDLNSRNGTFVNGAIIPGGSTQIIRDGDDVRFGNLVMRATFVHSDEGDDLSP